MPRESDSAAIAVPPAPAPVGDRKTVFMHQLAHNLRGQGITLISANLGTKGSEFVWVLAVQPRSRRVVTFDAALPPTIADPRSNEACQLLCERVLQWAQGSGADQDDPAVQK